ncbi:MAG: hypothetical protein F9K41_06165 [Sphingopyxis terrae]|nr:MAG: hypothetical protein F9K41_06165 [Sphingopyxis terrae]
MPTGAALLRLVRGSTSAVDLDTEEGRAFLQERLAAFKVPYRIWMATDALPKLGSEKIDKVSLRNKYREEFAAQPAA